jgi:hypothetical protein
MRKEAVTIYFIVLFQHLPGGTEETRQNLRIAGLGQESNREPPE